VPFERAHQPLQVPGQCRQLDALLHRGAAADPLDDAQVGVMRHEPAAVGERLHHGKRS
jgi:hypothetical protein